MRESRAERMQKQSVRARDRGFSLVRAHRDQTASAFKPEDVIVRAIAFLPALGVRRQRAESFSRCWPLKENDLL